MPPTSFSHVIVIANPVSGPAGPPLDEIQARLNAAGCKVEMWLTSEEVPIEQLAAEATRSAADLVLACGGDGTVMAVAGGLAESDKLMGILPAGTANVMAAELGLPGQALAALDVLLNGATAVRTVDLGQTEEGGFLLRVGFGWEAAMTVYADGPAKDRLGRWGYLFTALRLRRALPITRYYITVDDRSVSVLGVTCLICNSSNMGLPGMDVLPEVRVDDGLLDVVVLRTADWFTLIKLLLVALRSLFPGYHTGEIVQHTLIHRSGRRVSVRPQPVQVAARDGEPLAAADAVRAWLLPGAVRMVVPADEAEVL